MLTLFFFAAASTIVTAGVTVYAMATAEEGYEDEQGFHRVPNSPGETTDPVEDAVVQLQQNASAVGPQLAK